MILEDIDLRSVFHAETYFVHALKKTTAPVPVDLERNFTPVRVDDQLALQINREHRVRATACLFQERI